MTKNTLDKPKIATSQYFFILILVWYAMIDISEFRLTNVPSTAYYIPNFIDEHEEQAIIKEVNRAPKSKWVKLSNRRLQNWGGNPLPSVSNFRWR